MVNVLKLNDCSIFKQSAELTRFCPAFVERNNHRVRDKIFFRFMSSTT